MADYAGNLNPEHPRLIAHHHRPAGADEKPSDWLPELHVTVGHDRLSAGLSVEVWVDAGGQYAQHRVLYAARWADPPRSAEEALRNAYSGVAAALAELFGVDGT